jgi:type III secretion protein T
MNSILELAKPYEIYFIATLIISARFYGFVLNTYIMPQSISGRAVRSLLVIILSMPAIVSHSKDPTLIGVSWWQIMFVMIIEFAKGYLIGFSVGWIFWVVEAIGNVIDNQRGAAIASAVNPLMGQEASPIAILFSQAMITYFYAVGGMFVFLNIFYFSYLISPAGEFLPNLTLGASVPILGLMDQAFELMFLLASPLILVMFISEFALAMVSRFAPQIQVFVLAMPIKSALAIFMMIFYFKIALDYAVVSPTKFYGYASHLAPLWGNGNIFHDVIPYYKWNP